ncbi:MAG: MGMT family protein [Fimbriimonadaceae bacterium]|jgi:alkylated DNA nucleotide flippase Atl1|nr:MGMT family protein [Fimbriimonadaceae bacterium]
MGKRTKEALFYVNQLSGSQVISYKDLGLMMSPKISPRAVGSVMRSFPEESDWWRVIAQDGSLPTVKEMNTKFARQKSKLEEAGVVFENDTVLPRFFVDIDNLELLSLKMQETEPIE